MKKILRTSLFWIVVCISFWAYIRFFNADLWSKLSYCLMNAEQTESQTWDINYWNDILLINEQLNTIQDKVEDILQTLWDQEITDLTENVNLIDEISTIIDTWVISTIIEEKELEEE